MEERVWLSQLEDTKLKVGSVLFDFQDTSLTSLSLFRLGKLDKQLHTTCRSVVEVPSRANIPTTPKTQTMREETNAQLGGCVRHPANEEASHLLGLRFFFTLCLYETRIVREEVSTQGKTHVSFFLSNFFHLV
jgi:hypothetical protein